MLRFTCQASVPRDAFPPTPPGPEGSNGNGLLRVQWVSGAWLLGSRTLVLSSLKIPPGAQVPVCATSRVADFTFGPPPKTPGAGYERGLTKVNSVPFPDEVR